MRISTITNWAYGATVLLTGLSGGRFMPCPPYPPPTRRAPRCSGTWRSTSWARSWRSIPRRVPTRRASMRCAARTVISPPSAARSRPRAGASGSSTGFASRRSPRWSAPRSRKPSATVDELDTIERTAVTRAEAGDAGQARRLLYGPDHERPDGRPGAGRALSRAAFHPRQCRASRRRACRRTGFALFARIMLGITALLFLARALFRAARGACRCRSRAWLAW